MSTNISDSRKQQLEELKNFTDAVNKEIANIVETLGWTMESTMENIDTEHFICPYDSSHQLTEGSLNNHLISCQWKAEGYGKLDVPLSEPTLSIDSPFSIKFDEQLQDEILRKAKEQNPAMQTGIGERLIPRTSDRLLTDFTSDERKALYDYVISNTAKPDIGQDIAVNLKQEKKDKELSFLDLLVQERNLKRRRAKHRGVHTNKKSHIEILREVINQQMEIYIDYMCEKKNSDHVQPTESDDSNHEMMQDRTERLYKAFHTSSRNFDDLHSRDRNDHYSSKRNYLKREHSEEKNYHPSRERDRDRHEKYSDETHRKHRHTEHIKSSHSKDRKSHKKDKHRNRDRHTDRHQKKHKSDRDKSLERHSKHSEHKRKKKHKDY
ncbi:U11/U12 small nuclear ribonucleoprotein 48 kDa protein-like [Nylanderia fulva]|uniref:U11/U12 small nuclear ribonucleoprotein 48 kDa protein-like n=1 Tax=Nylanderia fulva TaxID=613905 RepID=UPI0010FAD8EE|nr:U11/U12 small nuclear ribonucleoprotein 48 kDa protein-like [Nylanderia fulva]